MRSTGYVRAVRQLLIFAFYITLIFPMICNPPVFSDRLGEGIKAYEEGRHQEAIEILKKAAEETPNDYAVHCWLGMVYGQQALASPGDSPEDIKRRAEATSSFHRCLKLNPDPEYKKTAESWLKRLRRLPNIFALMETEDLGCHDERMLKGIKSAIERSLVAIGNYSLENGVRLMELERAYDECDKMGATWLVWPCATYCKMHKPSPEKIEKWEKWGQDNKGNQEAQQKVKQLLVSRANLKLQIKMYDAVERREICQFAVSAWGKVPGYDDSAEKLTIEKVCVDLEENLRGRLARLVDIMRGDMIPAGVSYVAKWLHQGCCYCYSMKIPDATRDLPVTAIAPFTLSPETEIAEALDLDKRDIALMCTNHMARQLFLKGNCCLIDRERFQEALGENSAGSSYREKGLAAARDLGADGVWFGHVKARVRFIKPPLLGPLLGGTKIKVWLSLQLEGINMAYVDRPVIVAVKVEKSLRIAGSIEEARQERFDKVLDVLDAAIRAAIQEALKKAY